MQNDYNPNSPNAMFGVILQRLGDQDKILTDIRATQTSQAVSLDKRVSVLEHEKWFNRGVTATIGVGVSAIWQWLHAK